MNYVYIVAGSKLGTVMLNLAREGPFYRTWPRVMYTVCSALEWRLTSEYLVFLGLVFIYLLGSCYLQDT